MLEVIDPIASFHEIAFFFIWTLLTLPFWDTGTVLQLYPLEDTDPHCAPTFRDPEHLGHQAMEGSKTAPMAVLRENYGAELGKTQLFY